MTTVTLSNSTISPKNFQLNTQLFTFEKYLSFSFIYSCTEPTVQKILLNKLYQVQKRSSCFVVTITD